MISLTSVASDLYLAWTTNAAISTTSDTEISEEGEAKISVIPNTDISWTSNGGISEEAEAKISVVSDTDISWSSDRWISEKGESEISVVPNTDISWTSYSEISKSKSKRYSDIVPLPVSVLMVPVASVPLDSHLALSLERRSMATGEV